MSGVTPRLREVIGDVIGRPVAADEVIERVVDDLEVYVAERNRARVLASDLSTWQFSDVPELVVQTISESGVRSVHRIAGGPARADNLDPTQRRYARMLVQLALDHLDATEPARAEGRAL